MIYTIVCTDASPYINWQCDLLEYSWKRAAQPGQLLRLVTVPEDAPLPSHPHAIVSRVPCEPERYQGYKCLERLCALQHWLQRDRPSGTVLILDPDVVFLRPVPVEVAPASPRAQHWVDYQPPSPHTQAATWPLFIHTSDLESLLPAWIDLSVALYTVTRRWETDMYALVAAAAAAGLHFSLDTLGAFVGWPDEQVGSAPLVHYCQDVLDDAGRLLWSKRTYQPWARVPNAARAHHGYCRDLLALIDGHAASRPPQTHP